MAAAWGPKFHEPSGPSWTNFWIRYCALGTSERILRWLVDIIIVEPKGDFHLQEVLCIGLVVAIILRQLFIFVVSDSIAVYVWIVY